MTTTSSLLSLCQAGVVNNVIRPGRPWIKRRVGRRLLEEAANAAGPSGEPAHVAADAAPEFLLAARRRLAIGDLLEIGVQALVGGQFRAVGGQMDHLDLGRMRGQSLLHGAQVMHPQAVEAQKHLAAGVAEQTVQEADGQRRRDGAFQPPPAQFALVGQHRDRPRRSQRRTSAGRCS